MKKLWSGLIHLFYPQLCVCCNDSLQNGEVGICFNCLYELPRTRFHHKEDNIVSQLFWGRFPFNHATALFYYSKGNKYQQLIHGLKYRGNNKLGEILGSELGQEIKNNVFFRNIDFVIPVPLHRKKLKERGYNQSSSIANGIAVSLQTQANHSNLYRRNYTESQTKKTKFERWKNVENKFGIHSPELFENKHILLVDDIITTGATIEACANALNTIKGIKLSIASLGVVE